MKIEIFVQNPVNERWEIIDLFDDESVNINFKLKDLNDISKVFSTYSQDFTVPASGNNNKVFNYFFDTKLSRVRNRGLNAKIFINDALFRVGQIVIKEGQVDNFKLLNYKVEFRTVIAQLKEKIGDDIIGNVIGDTLSNDYSIQWDSQSVYDRIVWSTGDEDVLVPLISNRRVWTYGDGGDNDIKQATTGIDKFELRPAIKLRIILDLLIQHYDLNVDFPLKNNEAFDKLYVWLNNKSEDEEQPPVTYDFKHTQPWTLAPGGIPTNSKMFFDVSNDSGGMRIVDTGANYSLSRYYLVSHTLSNLVNLEDGQPYKGRLVAIVTERETGVTTTYEQNDINGSTLVSYRLRQGRSGTVRTYDISYIFDNPVDLGNINTNVQVLHHIGSGQPSNRIESYNNSLPIVHNDFNIKYALGDWKVIDLFSSIFKMFNIRVLEDYENMSMRWLTPQQFYSESSTFDINKYTDIIKYNIQPSTNYKEITFKHTDEGYFRNVEYKKLVEKEYGSEVYKSEDKVLTETYSVETKFSIMNWFLLTGTNLKTSYGFSKPNSPQEPSVPTIMYNQGFDTIRTDDNAMNVDFRFKIPTQGSPGFTNQLARYIKFGNQSNSNLYSYSTSLTFDIDIEPEANTPMLKSLYNNYYKSDIERLYLPNSNYFNFEGYFSLNGILTFDMRNKFIIEDNLYTIEESAIDITTGKFKMKLLNVLNLLESELPPSLNTFNATGGIRKIECALNVIDDGTEDIGNYEIQYRLSNSTGTWTSQLIPYVPFQSTVFNISPVDVGIYDVRGRTVNSQSVGGLWSTINNVEVFPMPTPLTFSADGGEQEIYGAINTGIMEADYYEIQYGISGNWLSYQLPYVPASSSIYSISPVTPPGIYQMRARMVGSGGIYSDWVTAPDVTVI